MVTIDHAFEGLSHTLVPASGPVPCPVLMVGESPGFEEDQAIPPRPFIGKTGQELDRFYLPMVGLTRRDIRITNLLPVHPFGNRDPLPEEIKFFEHYIKFEVEKTKPEFIVPLGAFATKYFLGGHKDLHTVHGLPHKSKKFPNQIIIPSYHPAAGLHQTETQALIVYDFQQIALALNGELPPRPSDDYKSPLYIELLTRDDVYSALTGVQHLIMGADTEGYKYHPWGLSFSVEPGISYVIRIQSKSAIKAYADWIEEHPDCVVILHNALHDLAIYRDMGIHIKNFEDTMVYAFCLCLEPQGLKDLAYRHCGMKMTSYEETVNPALRKATLEYLIKVAKGDWGLDPMVPECESAEDVKWRQPTALHKRAIRAINDIKGRYTGTIIGPRSGGSIKLDEVGVTVGKVDHETVARLGLKKEVPILSKKTGLQLIDKKTGLPKVENKQDMNAWFCEVSIPLLDRLDPLFGEFIWELKEPVAPEDPPDPIKRWEVMQEDLEESVARCEDVIGTLPMVGLDAIEDQQVAVNYSARDADATKRIQPILRQKVEANGLLELAKLDMSVLPYVDRMKMNGIMINRKHMLDYGAELKIEMRQLQEKLKQDLGIWINPQSPKHVAKVIYDMLGFPVKVRTEKGDPSTNDKVLEAMAPLHPSIHDITDYRELNKLRGTYALKLPRWMDSNMRLHPNWKVTRVPSGRFACSDPNLMAIPARTNRGKMIRKGFIPRPGCCFIGVDLSQIEMRVLAHLSQDPNLIDIFLSGKDFHSATAAFMWKLTLEQIEAEHKLNGSSSMRSSGKNVSFGIVYGVTAKGLQAQVKSKTHQEWSEEECQRMIDMWLIEAYPRVKAYMERQRYLAKMNGFVTTMMGRRRYLPGINSSIPRIREEAFRQAINHPVQGSAAEIIKIAMRNLWNDALPLLWASDIYCEPVLQIHDELIFEVQADAATECAYIVKDFMEKAVEICVPIMADFHVTAVAEAGANWNDLK